MFPQQSFHEQKHWQNDHFKLQRFSALFHSKQTIVHLNYFYDDTHVQTAHLVHGNYSRTSLAQTLMAQSPWLVRTIIMVPIGFVCYLVSFFTSQSSIFQLFWDRSSWVEPVLSMDKCALLKDTMQ